MNRVVSGIKMFRRKALSVWIMALAVLLFTRFGMDVRAGRQDHSPEIKLLLLIDTSFLSCSLCLQSLTEFIGIIQANKLEDSVLGVMIMDENKEETDVERHRKIAEKRLKGFIIGNNIQFPFLLDEERVFRPLNQDASATLIVFDSRKNTVVKYEFPLSKAQLTTIFQK